MLPWWGVSVMTVQDKGGVGAHDISPFPRVSDRRQPTIFRPA